MARYRVGHDIGAGWIARRDDGTFYWSGDSSTKSAHLFPNYRTAKEALDSMPDEKRSYGESYRGKVHFMRFYDSDEHFEREQAYLAEKRQLREWGH